MMEEQSGIRRAQSCLTDEREAVAEFYAGVRQAEMALVIFFCSSEYDLELLAEEMRRLFAGVQVVGCTTAGEIGPAGCCEHSLTGASFPASSFNAVSGHIVGLREFTTATGQAFVQNLLQRLEADAPPAHAENSFAFLMIDGLSMREEVVTRALQSALGRLPLIGGSAGDGERFDRTYTYFDGRFHRDSAVLVLVTTPVPFRLFTTQHFVATGERLVVTEADIELRIVGEINGLPAAQEYARVLGVDASELAPRRFAAWPVVVLIDGTNYVRSIQKANPDESLTFFCAIENGLVFRVAKGEGLVEKLEQAFGQVESEIGAPQFVLCCDCILRKLEIRQSLLQDRVNDIFRRNHVIGFNTYGEQFRGVHVNQTLVGLAIGRASMETEDA